MIHTVSGRDARPWQSFGGLLGVPGTAIVR